MLEEIIETAKQQEDKYKPLECCQAKGFQYKHDLLTGLWDCFCTSHIHLNLFAH